jgi:2-C-methyl-D-erythritol 2,4-cyclodiphosphate synthase
MSLRIGQGYDVHILKEGHSLILGGVNINHYKGTIAHSDGDVLIHAIIDALLGAANLGDIGKIFPDTDDKFKNIDSKILLSETAILIRNNNFEINNIDSTIVLQKPKIAEFIPKMKTELAKALSIEISRISIKATTTEKLGFEGREEGISAQAICLIFEK